ncbi:unnamed protein product [Paramecium pentaurelia]|uniref:Uncharacterized protein n=1 Tax=Paramecium pentaurelia TaxID=43138 RepID=A0A8S1YEG3_9CILI|nr:unnamed protein product [Paramecium pentaurelia]
MKSQKECQPKNLNSDNEKLEPQHLEIEQSDTKRTQQNKIKLKRNINQDNQLLYYQDGEAIRIEEFRPNQTQQDVLKNLDQIKFLFWHGKYDQNGKKTGYWYASWNGSILNSIGGYYKEGQKHGRWNQLSQNYHNSNKVYEIGEYCYNRKRGHWKYLFNDNLIGGGQYDEGCFEFKVGKWIELDDGYNQQKQVTYDGEYINGKKVGIWNIWFDQNGIKKNIGTGVYDHGVRNGYCIELFDGLNFQSEIIQYGLYQNGKRVGRWDIKYMDNQIGGGLYDQEGKGVKIGQWIDISDGFKLDSQITYIGQYNKQGKKVGKWEIKLYGANDMDEEDYDEIQGLNITIGDGLYDQEGQGNKIGQWIDISYGFEINSQVIYNGQYQNGKKIGRWVIHYKMVVDYMIKKGKELKLAGGLKLAMDLNLILKQFMLEDINMGKKLVNGKFSVENWVKANLKRCNYQRKQQQIFSGVGQYNEVGQEVKIGQWIDIDGNYSENSQVTYHGEYKNGIKVGRWDFWFNYNDHGQERKRIGGGSYDKSDQGVKTGYWIDLSEEFSQFFQLIQNGQYKQGKKVGKWDIWLKEEIDQWGLFFLGIHSYNIDFNQDRNKKEIKIIGGGQYDKQNQGFKVGLWIDLSDQFKKYEQVLYQGEYINGKKAGVWKVLKKDYKVQNDEFKFFKEIQYDN